MTYNALWLILKSDCPGCGGYMKKQLNEYGITEKYDMSEKYRHTERYDRIEQECVEYFRQASVWNRLFKGFESKYESYGYFTGTVKLTKLSESDIETLEGYFGKNYHGKKSLSISADSFSKVLASGRYKDVRPERIIELYLGGKLVGKKEQKEKLLQERDAIVEELSHKYADTPAGQQLNEIVRNIKWDKSTDMGEWKKSLELGIRIVNHFPYHEGKVMYLAVFATMITGNPHAFDMGTEGGKLLNALIQSDLWLRGIQVSGSEVFHSYKRQKSYLETGIMIDDISNYAMLSGVHAYNRDGSLHSGMEGFYTERDTVLVPLAVIMKWDRLECPGNKIYIVENPSVYAVLSAKGTNDSAYMCMNGQPRLASLIIMELLAKSGTTVYYSGDFDPEGLLIAQKLSMHYKGEFHYYHMTEDDYMMSLSEEIISPKRLKMLENITDERLRKVADKLLCCRLAGYQEKNMPVENG